MFRKFEDRDPNGKPQDQGNQPIQIRREDLYCFSAIRIIQNQFPARVVVEVDMGSL